MKFLIPNYSCLQNPWLGATTPRSPFSLSSTEYIEPPLPRTKFLGTPLHLHDVTLALVTVLTAGDKVASDAELLFLGESTNRLIKQNIFSLLDGFLVQFIQLLYITFNWVSCLLENLSKHHAWPASCDFWKNRLVRARAPRPQYGKF